MLLHSGEWRVESWEEWDGLQYSIAEQWGQVMRFMVEWQM